MQPTQNIYILPLLPETKILKIVSDGPGHPGPYKGAVDFAVEPDTDVLAPFDGEIITVLDAHDKYGNDPKFAKFANYVQIAHANGETSDLIHLAHGSILVKVGYKVRAGQMIAKTGLSGYMTAPHLHWFVFARDSSEYGFHGLHIRIKDDLDIYK